MPGDDRKTLARSLGEFVGHLWRGVRADVSQEPAPRRVERKEEHAEQRAETPAATLIARRTVIEEIEVIPKEPGP